MPLSSAQSEIVAAIGWTLLHSLWQGALVGIVFAALRGLIPFANSRARYANGLFAMALLLLLPLATLYSMLAAPAPADAVVESVLVDSVPIMAAPSAAASPMQAALGWLVLLWIAGVVLAGYRSWCQWRSLVRIARDWAEPLAGLEATLAGLTRRFDLPRRVRVLMTDHVDTPILFGWFKPVILLPTAVALGFPRQQLELILAHELGHLRRYDHLVNLAQAFVETLLFYHPVAHWISREIRNEREICCDRLVLERTSGEPREYARTLAALEELRHPVQLALAASGGVLFERVRRIVGVGQESSRNRSRQPWLLVIGGMAVALLVALRVQVPEPVDVATIERVLDRPLLQDVLPLDRFVVAPPALPLAMVPTLPSEESAPEPPRSAVSERMPAQQPSGAPAPASVVAAAVVPTTRQQMSPSSVPTEPAATMVAEVVASSPAIPAPVPIAEEHGPAPRPMYRVSPDYPDSGSDRVERVRLEFAIAADGKVGGVKVTSRQPAAFARAAERALKQWRFGGGSFDAGRRYSQTFVFEPHAEDADSGCVRRTGSKLCRRSSEPESPLDASSSRIADASGEGHHGS